MPMDLIDLTRLATLAFMPLSVAFGLALLAVLAIFRGQRRWALTSLVLAMLLLLPLSLPVVASALLESLEGQYPPTDPARCERADAIVVLGGAVRPRLQGDPFARLHRGSDRVAVAAALYRARCAPLVFVAAGGKGTWPVIEPEALAIRSLLVRLGVPETAIAHEQASRNTGQNAAEAWRSLSAQEIDKILLVTSAWHLPRAVAEFEAVGFSVLPFGSDYRGFLQSDVTLMNWWPDAEALLNSQRAVKEYLGLWAQPFR